MGWAELPPHHYLDKHTRWQPHTTTHRCWGTEPCQEQAIKRLLQSQKHWQHCLAGRNEPAKLFLMTTTGGLAQPPALAQSAWINSKPYQVSAVVKHHMPMVWEHQFQTTDSLQSPLSSEKVVSVLLSATLKHLGDISEQLKINKPQGNKFKILKNSNRRNRLQDVSGN